MPPFITDGLRACQIDAVSALEVSMAQNRPRALAHVKHGLAQMATGAGKTFTACTIDLIRGVAEIRFQGFVAFRCSTRSANHPPQDRRGGGPAAVR
jgi:hypothetical protein